MFALWQYLIDVDIDKVEEIFTDNRGIFRSLKSGKGRQYSDKQKREQRNKQRSTKHKI